MPKDASEATRDGPKKDGTAIPATGTEQDQEQQPPSTPKQDHLSSSRSSLIANVGSPRLPLSPGESFQPSHSRDVSLEICNMARWANGSLPKDPKEPHNDFGGDKHYKGGKEELDNNEKSKHGADGHTEPSK